LAKISSDHFLPIILKTNNNEQKKAKTSKSASWPVKKISNFGCKNKSNYKPFDNLSNNHLN